MGGFHARKCKADSAMENGFIFAVDSSRLFAVVAVKKNQPPSQRVPS
jgi:hypothetical protein